jgi:hypothetical protein
MACTCRRMHGAHRCEAGWRVTLIIDVVNVLGLARGASMNPCAWGLPQLFWKHLDNDNIAVKRTIHVLLAFDQDALHTHPRLMHLPEIRGHSNATATTPASMGLILQPPRLPLLLLLLSFSDTDVLVFIYAGHLMTCHEMACIHQPGVERAMHRSTTSSLAPHLAVARQCNLALVWVVAVHVDFA